MEFCNMGYGSGNLEMEFCNGVAMENLKWNFVIGTVGMEILKWNSNINANEVHAQNRSNALQS